MIHYITTTGIGNAWVANELRIVQQAGIPFVLHGLRGPQQRFFDSDWAMDLLRQTRTIYPLSAAEVAFSLLRAPFVFRGRFLAALVNALFGKRESFRTRIAALAHFVVACCWALKLRKDRVSHIHAQWVHSSGSVGMYGAWLLGKTFSFTGHAADLFRDRVALEDKIRRAEFIICISTFHKEFFKQLGARDEQLHIAYCGIDPSLFSPRPHPHVDGGPLQIRSSGRLVEKKGFADLIRACGLLRDRGIDFQCVIAGSGPLQESLHELIDSLRLHDRVWLTGAEIKQEEIPEFMHGGDIYCLQCVWASDNDVDGLPQMLMEAMACGLPAISTRLVGIPDLIIDGKTGLLIEPGNVEQLADAIERLKNDPPLAARLVANAHQHLLENFDITTCLEPLIELFRQRLEGSHETALRPERELATVGGAS